MSIFHWSYHWRRYVARIIGVWNLWYNSINPHGHESRPFSEKLNSNTLFLRYVKKYCQCFHYKWNACELKHLEHELESLIESQIIPSRFCHNISICDTTWWNNMTKSMMKCLHQLFLECNFNPHKFRNNSKLNLKRNFNSLFTQQPGACPTGYFECIK